MALERLALSGCASLGAPTIAALAAGASDPERGGGNHEVTVGEDGSTEAEQGLVWRDSNTMWAQLVCKALPQLRFL